jgi:hypothetical protein
MIKQLIEPFKLNIQNTSGLHFISFNGSTTVLNDEEIEQLEYNLTDINHAITMYKIATKLGEKNVG